MFIKSNISKNSPIGIFDSGIGGLSVAAELSCLLPSENFIYVGDTANFPYGKRSAKDICDSVKKIGKWLQDQGCKLVIIACNTATAAGLSAAKSTLSIPVVGVVEPGARTAVKYSHNKRIGILATQACVLSRAYSKAINKIDETIKVIETPAPGLVEVAENELPACVLHHDDDYETLFPPSTKQTLSKLTSEYCKRIIAGKCDTVVLGCTHFPFVKPAIQKTVGPDVKLVSPSAECVNDATKILKHYELLNDKIKIFNNNIFYSTGPLKNQYMEFSKKVFSIENINVDRLDI